MTRTMYDAVTPGNIPSGATLIAGYADGLYANLGELRTRFPHATIVSIAVRYTTRAQVLDVETGDATPAEAVLWCTTTMADKANRDLTVYCNTSTWPAVRAAFRAAGVSEPNYWVAAYDGNPTIPPGAIAKQWADVGPYDQSVVADYWPGVDSAPVPVTKPPAPAPAPTPSPIQEADMPQWTSTPLAPSAQPTVVLVPRGNAWTAYPHRTLHLGMDEIGTPGASATVRVAVHNGTDWAHIATVTVTAAGGVQDVDVTGAAKVSLQTTGTGVSYAVETW